MIRLVLCKLHCSGPAENGPQRSKGKSSGPGGGHCSSSEERWWCLTPAQPYSQGLNCFYEGIKKTKNTISSPSPEAHSQQSVHNLFLWPHYLPQAPSSARLSHSQHTVFQPAQTGCYFPKHALLSHTFEVLFFCPELHVPSLLSSHFAFKTQFKCHLFSGFPNSLWTNSSVPPAYCAYCLSRYYK